MVDYQQASPALPGAIVAHIDYTRRPIQWYLQKEGDIEETLPVFFPFGSAIAPDEADDKIGPPIDGISGDRRDHALADPEPSRRRR